MIKSICIALLLSILPLLGVSEGVARERLALVIGNGAYETISTLPNPTNDADLIARTLQKIGFKVTTENDVTHDQMRSAMKRFGEALEDAGPDSIAVFYYAGHAVQLRGANYLLPVDARISDESDLSIEGIHLDLALHQIAHAELAASFIIIDACRDNPFSGQVSLPDGLAQIRAPRRSIIAYSTEPGGVAMDGVGRNSPYTSALAKELLEPGYPAELMFKQVRRHLLDATGSQQISWESSSLTEDFFFVPGSRGTRDLTDLPPARQKLEIDWDDFYWKDLSAEQRKHWSVLGWTEQSWNEGTTTPQTENMIWEMLSAEQKTAAKALGYSKSIWDGTL